MAHTTISSIAQARQHAEAEGFSVEFFITLDNHDDLTEVIVRKHPAVRETDTIEPVQFGDPGDSRNYAISKASGEYIVCMDGDDYYSQNYITASVHEAMQGKNIVVCPDYLVSFGAQYHWTRFGGPEDFLKNSYVLFSEHLYCATVTAHRDVFLRVPFTRCEKGFGYEDWHWNLEARGAGLEHKIAHDTVLFYRRKPVSVSKAHTSDNAVVPRSCFFEMLPKPEQTVLPPVFSNPRNLPQNVPFPWKQAIKSLLLRVLRLMPKSVGGGIYSILRDWQHYAKLCALFFLKHIPESLGKKIRPRLVHIWKARTQPGSSGLDPVLHQALLRVSRVDGLMHPDRMPPIPFYPRVNDETPGRVYATAWHALPGRDYDMVYTAPHINIGGADIMTLNYIKTVCAEGKRVLFITTAGTPNRFESLPQQVDILDLGIIIANLRYEDRVAIFVRLLLQLAPSAIHMINDHFGFQCIAQHGQALKQYSKLFVSIFADAQDHDDYYYGPGTEYLRKLHPYVERVVTDNSLSSRKWVELFGLSRDLFQPVYAMNADPIRMCSNPASRDRVLWAGRLDFEKRLDIAYDIAKEFPEMYFDFYGKGVLNLVNPAVGKLKTLPNVTFFGEHAGFSTLPAEKYFAFLYTTQCDGLPIVLLEATAAGLPIVAPDRGGIRDFITEDTGWLVSRHTDISSYVQALRAMRANPEEAQARCKRAQKLLTERHNEASFANALLSAYTAKRTTAPESLNDC